MRIASQSAAFIAAAGFFLAFIVGLNWLCYIYQFTHKPELPLWYSLLIIALGIFMILKGRVWYAQALRREAYERILFQQEQQMRIQRDLKAYWENTIKRQSESYEKAH
jgi:hypothetical protein